MTRDTAVDGDDTEADDPFLDVVVVIHGAGEDEAALSLIETEFGENFWIFVLGWWWRRKGKMDGYVYL